MFKKLPLVLLVTLAGLANDAGVNAASFNLAGSATVDNPAPGANAKVTTGVTIAAPDSLPQVVVSFLPALFFVAADADVPDGAAVATATNPLPRVSLANGTCNTPSQFSMALYDATTDMSQQIWLYGSFDDFDGDGLHNGIEYYPDFLTRLFPGAAPRARLYGDTVIANVDISLNVVVFEPGTPIGGFPLDPALGYPTVAVLQDYGDPLSFDFPGFVTDICTPLAAQIAVFGTSSDNPNTTANEGGFVYRTNPASASTLNFVTFAVSQQDADSDGIENAIDSCHGQDNLGDPRIQASGDADQDGLDDACDPDSFTPNHDQDGDQYLNRQDNCPLAANGPHPSTNQGDIDLDRIGNECDPEPTTPNGHRHTRCAVAPVVIGAGGPPTPPNPLALFPCNLALLPDLDGDGVRNADETHCGSDPENADARPERIDGVFDNVSDDGDTQVDEPLPPGAAAYDCDGDGYTGSAEAAIFAPATQRDQDPCGTNGWPADVVTDTPETANKVTLADVQSFLMPVRRLNTSPGNANYHPRWDLVPGGLGEHINVQDMQKLAFVFPPMLGGATRAFNGPVCPWTP